MTTAVEITEEGATYVMSEPICAMVRINGKSFRCLCGCNVFSTWDHRIYKCNACEQEYEGD